MQSLGLDEKLSQWIELKSGNTFLTNAFEASERELLAKKSQLHEIQSEMSEKLFTIFDAVPPQILETLPGYDSKVYERLKFFNRRVNAKIRQTDRKLSTYQDRPEDNYESPPPAPRNPQFSPIRDIETRDFIDPRISPPWRRTNFQPTTFQPKRPLSACFGPTIAENPKYSGAYSESAATASWTNAEKPKVANIVPRVNEQTKHKEGQATATLKNVDGTAQNNVGRNVVADEDGLVDIDMQGFLAVYGDSEEFFTNDNNNTKSPQSQNTPNFLQQFPDGNNAIKSLLASNTSDKSTVQLFGNVRNDGENREFNTLDHPHCQQMLRVFRNTFGLHLFRPNQLSAINAVILGYDCFVLMPTGGGKSLCYQLPALLATGITIVISPLRSLILDQTQKLLSLDVPAMYMTGDQTDRQQSAVYLKLRESNSNLRLLYVTPEKLSLSPKFMETLNFLYEQGRIARFVIDEVHCVSQWGHDFRPDYKKLNMLRQRFPLVPLMALTATATQRVRIDILHQLNINSPKWFISSFNRPNLRYSVMAKKAKSSWQQINDIIKEKFENYCGIVYCISRKDCDDLAQFLAKNGLKALSYHAGLPDKMRTERQSQWVAEKVKIIVATIAFGMGIDKPNVRFVIHGAMPKSIEGYYQESGRAGRDGEPADCILMYSYGDVYRYRSMFEKSENMNPEALKTHIENLNRMVHFCDNLADCRRALQLNYFGEIFDRQECIGNKKTMCDNCRTYDQFVELDVTEHAVNLVKLIQALNSARQNCVTMLQVVDIYKGSEITNIAYKLGDRYQPWYGLGNSMTKYEIERLLHILVVNNYLCENMEPNNGIVCAYVVPGRLANQLLCSGNIQICLQKKAAKRPTTKPKSSNAPSQPQFSAVTNAALKDIEQRCYEELFEFVNGIAGALEVSANSIMNMVALRKMSIDLPTTQTAMMKIPHVTKANFEKYGKSLLEITQKYSREKDTLLEEEGEIQRAYQDLNFEEIEDEDDDWSPINKKRSRGNGQQAKRFKQSNNNNNNFGIGGTSCAPRANFNSGGRRGRPATRKNSGRGRGGGNAATRGGRGPGLMELMSKSSMNK